jgi:ATP adenylyltransferase
VLDAHPRPGSAAELDALAPGCRFCAYFGQSSGAANVWDTELTVEGDVKAFPSKGALVAPWVLLVPRAHVLSMSELDRGARHSLVSLLPRVAESLSAAFGCSVTLFEHGAVTRGSSFGCGLDHAHLHAVCLPFDLLDRATELFPEITWTSSAAPWERTTAERAYLSVTDRTGRWFSASPQTVPKQFFRQVIASALGRANEYDYDAFTQVTAVTECVDRLRTVLAKGA